MIVKIQNKAKQVISTIKRTFREFDIDKIIETLEKCEFLDDKTFKTLCIKAQSIFQKQPNVVQLQAPLTICGDVHGQFPDLIELLKIGGKVGQCTFLFLGDYVDRGHYSLETISLLLAYKLKYPTKMILLRGNHESRRISKDYGFYDQINEKYGNTLPWNWVTDTFDFMPLCALINKSILCMHGGLSPHFHTIDQIRELERAVEVPLEGPITDLLWSDPSDGKGFDINLGRGVGFRFGADSTKYFCHRNNLERITRAHEVCMQGFDMNHENKLMTLFSAPNYCYVCGNKGAVVSLDSNLRCKIHAFGQTTEYDVHDKAKHVPKYFT